MNIIIDKDGYNTFLTEIKDRIRKAQYEALKSVNKELINLYWDVGRMIVERQEKYEWGKSVVENLAKDLQNEFPGIQGFSDANLWRIRAFYLQYKDNEKLAPLVREISWTKNVLINQIENKAYQQYLLNQTNFDKAVPEKYRSQAKLAVKDEYTFDFLELGEEHSEKELESALVNKIRHFLTEMGNYFCFIANQYRIEIDDEEFFIDLLLYHRKLKCLVAIELKIGNTKIP